MSFSTTSRQRLGLLAAACLLSVALPAGTAVAQKTKTKNPPITQAAPEPSFNVDIPAIDSVGSNVDDAILRAIFSGNLADHADALAGLTAASITIPQLTLEASTTIDGEPSQSTIVFSDIVLSDVTDGTAASISLSGMTLDATGDVAADFGTLSASSFNIGGVLGLYGLVDAGQRTAMETIYTDFSFAGGTVTAPDTSCTIGAASVAELKARPLQSSLPEIMALIEQMDQQEDDLPPEAIGTLLNLYVDLFTAFESSPASFDGFSCDSLDDEGRPLTVSVAGMSMDGISPGIYPAITLQGMDITAEGDGTAQIGSFTIKATDLTGPIAAIKAAPAVITEAWFTANARALIPAFGGFSFGDVVVDVPDPDVEDSRIQGSIGAFDLSLAKYINGIPTDFVMTASNIVADLPLDSDDEQLRQLIDLGVTTIDAGFAIKASWNESDSAIAIDEISITGADLATVSLAGTITNATSALFGLNDNAALSAAMGLAIGHLKLDIADSGLSDLVLAALSADQGASPETMRPVYAGLAEGTVIGLLAGAAEAQKVGAALNAFISGSAKYLTIEMTAKNAPGLSLVDFMAAESDPTSLIGKVTIDASAK